VARSLALARDLALILYSKMGVLKVKRAKNFLKISYKTLRSLCVLERRVLEKLALTWRSRTPSF